MYVLLTNACKLSSLDAIAVNDFRTVFPHASFYLQIMVELGLSTSPRNPSLAALQQRIATAASTTLPAQPHTTQRPTQQPSQQPSRPSRRSRVLVEGQMKPSLHGASSSRVQGPNPLPSEREMDGPSGFSDVEMVAALDSMMRNSMAWKCILHSEMIGSHFAHFTASRK